MEQSVRAEVTKRYSATDLVYFTEQFSKDIKEWVGALSSESQRIGKVYKEVETFPDRYSYFWVSVVSNASHIVFIVKWHHINRRHAFSADGWALMTSERVFYVGTQEAGSLRDDVSVYAKLAEA